MVGGDGRAVSPDRYKSGDWEAAKGMKVCNDGEKKEETHSETVHRWGKTIIFLLFIQNRSKEWSLDGDK